MWNVIFMIYRQEKTSDTMWYIKAKWYSHRILLKYLQKCTYWGWFFNNKLSFRKIFLILTIHWLSEINEVLAKIGKEILGVLWLWVAFVVFYTMRVASLSNSEEMPTYIFDMDGFNGTFEFTICTWGHASESLLNLIKERAWNYIKL